MLVAQLRHFADFESLPPAALEVIAERARRLRLPARRWLVRPGRVLPDRYYLFEGRARLLEGGRSGIVNAGSARARRAVYPGAAGVETLTSAVFVSIDPALLECEAGSDTQLGVPEVTLGESSWQRRFLTSPLMQRLDPIAWQRILRAMRSQRYERGALVIEAGQRADCCYVLCSGQAQIRTADGTAVVAVLEPGALFGEDALVSGRERNADVVMNTAGSVVSLAAEQFQAWLLDAVVRPLRAADGRPLISLGPDCPSALLPMPLAGIRTAARSLSPAQRYGIVGGGWRERSLAAFLLAEQGINARPLA
jgi:CRP-like cAMP-binding protein